MTAIVEALTSAQPTTLLRSRMTSGAEENATTSYSVTEKINSLSIHISIIGSIIVSSIESLNDISSSNTPSFSTVTTIVSDRENNSHKADEVLGGDEKEKETETESMCANVISSDQSVPQIRGIASSKSEVILCNWEHHTTIRSDDTSQDIGSSIYDCSWTPSPRMEADVQARSVLENSVGPLPLAYFDADGLADNTLRHTGNCHILPTASEN
ncbi:unnamed protein product, partial [Dibothriocephalus latus]